MNPDCHLHSQTPVLFFPLFPNLNAVGFCTGA